jgi:predicted acyl esterase
MFVKHVLPLLLVLLLVAPPAAAQAPPELPPPTYPATVKQELLIEMDDGVKLAATLWFPSQDGAAPAPGRFPVVFAMTPYGRTNPGVGGFGMETIFAQRGFVSALVDIRGAGGSGGTLEGNYFSPREARDGGLLVQWLGTQPWSSGKVGMTGGSYLGITQYLTAGQAPKHLAAISPIVALSDLYRDAWAHGGVPNGFFGAQYLGVQGGPGTAGASTDPALLGPTIQHKLGQRPPGFIAFDFLSRPEDGDFYRERSPINVASKIGVPVLILGGWRDGLLRGAPEMYGALSERKRIQTSMTIGPCTHKGCGAPFAALNDPPGVQDDVPYVYEFLAHHLKGDPMPDRPRVKLYLQGANRYVESDRYPPRGSAVERLHLQPDGALAGTPTKDEGEQSYATNPSDGFSMAFDKFGTVAISPYVPTDQRLETGRGLTWRTPPLAEPLTLAGPLALHLVASSSAVNTDWHAKVSDVAPDGTESIVTQGALRASHRRLDRERSTATRPYHTNTEPEPLEPGRRYAFDVEIWPTGYELAKSHRLQVRLTSSNLPTHFPGTFRVDAANPALSAYEPIPPAVNTVHLGGADPSSLAMTVLRNGGDARVLPAPSSRRCASRRRFIIRLRHPRGDRLRAATVTVDGKRVRVRRGRRWTATLDWRGRPRVAVRVKVTGRTRSGRRVRDDRTYRLCRRRGA